MASISMDEIKANYIASMGTDLGSCFYELYYQLTELHIFWQQYRQLFGTDSETVELLNRTAGLFFKVVQDQLWDSVLLGISRLTDPSQTGKNKNLTLRSLPGLIPEESVRVEVEALCEKAVAEAKFARQHRNKRIAHQDHEYLLNREASPLAGISRQRIEAILRACSAVMNHIDGHYRDTTVIYHKFVDGSGARLLTHKLRVFEKLKSESKKP